MAELTGSVAVISGGLGDIGQAIARELAARGAAVAISDVRSASDAEPFLAELRADGKRARYDVVDVTDAAAVAAWIQAVEEDFGVPDLIIPNAAIVTLRNWKTVTPDEWTRELNINLTGGFHLAQSGAKRLLAAEKPGRVVFVGSWAAHAAHPNIVAYSVAKAGLRMLMQCLALDLASHGILVNEVAPGYVDAGLSGRIFDDNPGAREAAAARIPTHQLITAAEVAAQVAHLCAPANRHTTGSVLLMDGGLSLVTPAAGNNQR